MKNKENESYKIELCSEYIKSNNLGIKKQFKKHIVETGNKKFDEIGFLEKVVLNCFIPVMKIWKYKELPTI